MLDTIAQAFAESEQRRKVERELRLAQRCLADDYRQRFGRGRIDHANRRLIGDHGLTLQWATGRTPRGFVTLQE